MPKPESYFSPIRNMKASDDAGSRRSAEARNRGHSNQANWWWLATAWSGIILGLVITDTPLLAQPETVPKAHQMLVSGLEFLSDGRLVSGSLDGTLKVWDVRTGKLQSTLETADPVFSVATDPRSARCAWATSKGFVFVSRLVTQHADPIVAHSWDTLHQKTFALGFHPHQSMLITAGQDGYVRLWTPESQELLGEFEITTGDRLPDVVFDLAIVPSEKLFLAATERGTTAITPTDSGVHLTKRRNHPAYGVAVADSEAWYVTCWHRDGVGMSRFDNPTRVDWVAQSRRSGPVYDVAIAPGSETVLYAGADTKLHFATVRDRRIEHRRSVAVHQVPIYRVAVSPDGRRAASADESGVIVLWNMETASVISAFFDPKL